LRSSADKRRQQQRPGGASPGLCRLRAAAAKRPGRAAIALALSIAAAAAAGCDAGAKSSPAPAHPATQAPAQLPASQFLHHADLAFGVWHRYVYGPYKAGAFARPGGPRSVLGSAAAAALLSSRELGQAAALIRNTRLKNLFAPMTLVASRLKALRGELARGQHRPQDIDAINAGLTQIAAALARAGVAINDRVTPAHGLR